jgi:hypothetical protein
MTFSGSLFIPNGFSFCFLSENFHGFYSSVNLLHFSSMSLFHVSSEKFSGITLSGSLFIPNGFVPCFLSEKFHGIPFMVYSMFP